MTLFLSVILLRLVLEDDYLLALAIFYYCSCYSSSYVRSTYFDILTFAENEYLVKSYNVTNRSIQLFDCDDVTLDVYKRQALDGPMPGIICRVAASARLILIFSSFACACERYCDAEASPCCCAP